MISTDEFAVDDVTLSRLLFNFPSIRIDCTQGFLKWFQRFSRQFIVLKNEINMIKDTALFMKILKLVKHEIDTINITSGRNASVAHNLLKQHYFNDIG